MAAIPALPIEAMSEEVITTIGSIAACTIAEHPSDELGVKRALQQLAQLVTATVQSVITMKSSIVDETGKANTSFKTLGTSVIELGVKTRHAVNRRSDYNSADRTLCCVKLCETKSISNLKVFGEDRSRFRPWHDKFVNANSQHFNGVRELFQEMKTQLITEKYALKLSECQAC